MRCKNLTWISPLAMQLIRRTKRWMYKILLSKLGAEKDVVGHRCFDEQYLSLLALIHTKGEHKIATKGPHRKAARESAITIDLAASRADSACGYFMPLTSLRKLNFKHVASEALWYLRGEDHIRFLRRHGNPFWDAVAGSDEGLFVGLNYGLLVNFPRDDGGEPINQLEENMIARLIRGQCS